MIQVRRDDKGEVEGYTWNSAPVTDATSPEIVGTRGQRVRFYTDADIEKVIQGCKALGLKIVKIAGGRIYRRTWYQPVKFAHGGTGVELRESGMEGMYQIVCSLPAGALA